MVRCTGEVGSTTLDSGDEEVRKRGLGAPTALSASISSPNQVELRWMDNSIKEDGFEVERASVPSGPWTKIGMTSANISTYIDSGLEASSSYSYRVRAYNASGASS